MVAAVEARHEDSNGFRYVSKAQPPSKTAKRTSSFWVKTKIARVQDNGRIAFAFFPAYLHVWDIQQLF